MEPANQMRKVYRISASDKNDSLEVMITYPNGSVKFVGLWEALNLLWRVGVTERKQNHIVYINGEQIK